jgi:hypothetical protein
LSISRFSLGSPSFVTFVPFCSKLFFRTAQDHPQDSVEERDLMEFFVEKILTLQFLVEPPLKSAENSRLSIVSRNPPGNICVSTECAQIGQVIGQAC